MKKVFILILWILAVVNGNTKEAPLSIRVMTDGFNASEGIIVADQIRDLVLTDSLLCPYNENDSSYVIVEIRSFRDGGTTVITADFSLATIQGKNKLDYQYSRRLVSKTLLDIKEISKNIVEKIHLIQIE
jgi:hypothetical protein